MEEISFEELRDLISGYLQANRSIPIANPQERQGNSKLWEKDIEKYCRERGFEFSRSDADNPDFGNPLNFDAKTIRVDRKTKTFTVAPLTEAQAQTGILSYRIVILIWRYDSKRRRGYPL